MPLSFEIVSEAVLLESIAGYFDALIGASARVHAAKIISKDKAFTEMGITTEW